MPTVLFSYISVYAPYQLVYGLHPLIPTKYIVLVTSGDERDGTLMKV